MSLSARESSIAESIARRGAALLTELAEHVAIPTGTGHAEGIDEYRELLLGRLAALGGTVDLRPGDPRPAWLDMPRLLRDGSEDGAAGAAIGTSTARPAAEPPVTAVVTRRTSGAQRDPALLLAGHLDTVHDPHGAFRRLSVAPDGRTATGPGAADMKGGILVAIAALEALAEHGADVPWTFLLNADEETGSFHSASALTEEARRHRVGLALEPALPDGSLVVARMGTGQFRIAAHGRAAHVGREFARGVSAVYALARTISTLESFVDLRRGVIVNVGPLLGGSVTNAVPDHAACWGNVRFADDAIQHELMLRFRELATHAETLPRIEVETAFNRPAKPMTPEVERLAVAAREVAEALGQSLPFATTGGVCDGNILQAAGLPVIDTLGVRGGNLHRSDEFVETASLVERAQLLALLIRRLDEAMAPQR
ncbi:MAG TPA: M20/M25/M40 family metallo-hydrolase [Phycisphaerales bacterium]|nr:M20/M25/M40 family metallo-hydrolase [Phycisphaerales bacterium]HMP36561.1 M20/M25/M40 family metallo-hydrolase [Phycisphaerales bacterium]